MQDLWARLERFFAEQNWPVSLRPGAGEAEIARVEQALGLRFPADLLETGVYFYEAETCEQVIPQNLEALHTGAVQQSDFYRRLFPLAGGVTNVSG